MTRFEDAFSQKKLLPAVRRYEHIALIVDHLYLKGSI